MSSASGRNSGDQNGVVSDDSVIEENTNTDSDSQSVEAWLRSAAAALSSEEAVLKQTNAPVARGLGGLGACTKKLKNPESEAVSSFFILQLTFLSLTM